MSSLSPTESPRTIEIGSETIALPSHSAEDSDFDVVKQTITFECLSGGLVTGTWYGIRLDELLAEAGVPEETTHLVVTADDEHTACLPLIETMSALLALRRIDEPNETYDIETPRIVGPDVDGPRAIKNVACIEPVKLAPNRNPAGLKSSNHA